MYNYQLDLKSATKVLTVAMEERSSVDVDNKAADPCVIFNTSFSAA